MGTARRLPALLRVLGRAAAAALELRVQSREQQRQRRDRRPARRCWLGATTAAQIADRIEQIVFAGEMPPADKAALITYLRPDPPRARGSATRSAWRCRRPASSGTDGSRLTGGAEQCRMPRTIATIHACDEYQVAFAPRVRRALDGDGGRAERAGLAAARHLRAEPRTRPRHPRRRSSCAAARTG